MILRAIKELTLDNILALRGRETEETNGIYPKSLDYYALMTDLG